MEDAIKARDVTLGKIADIVLGCPYFGNYDWCVNNCTIYQFCDGVYEVQKAENQKSLGEVVKEVLMKSNARVARA